MYFAITRPFGYIWNYRPHPTLPGVAVASFHRAAYAAGALWAWKSRAGYCAVACFAPNCAPVVATAVDLHLAEATTTDHCTVVAIARTTSAARSLADRASRRRMTVADQHTAALWSVVFGSPRPMRILPFLAQWSTYLPTRGARKRKGPPWTVRVPNTRRPRHA